jgi:hypothetical protein
MAKTRLKVIKASGCSLISLYHLMPCMSRSLTTWSCQVNLAERSLSSFALTVVRKFLPSLSSGDDVGGYQWEVQALRVGFRTRARHRCRVPKKVFTSRAR